MKKEQKQRIILFSLLGIVGLVVLFMYYIMPRWDDLTVDRMELNEIRQELDRNDSIFNRVERLTNSIDEKQEVVDRFKALPLSFKLSSHSLLEHIGHHAENLDVNVTQFQEIDIDSYSTHNERHYHVVLQGGYNDILRVVSSLNDIDIAHRLSKMSAKVITVNAETGAPLDYVADENKYKWTSGNRTYVTGDFPLFVNQDGVVNNAEVVNEEGNEEDSKEKEIQMINRVQLEFQLTFLEFEDRKLTSEGSPELGSDYEEVTSSNDPQLNDEVDVVYDRSYRGEDLPTLNNETKNVFRNSPSYMREIIDLTQLAIYNKEQANEDTKELEEYLVDLLMVEKELSEETDEDE